MPHDDFLAFPRSSSNSISRLGKSARVCYQYLFGVTSQCTSVKTNYRYIPAVIRCVSRTPYTSAIRLNHDARAYSFFPLYIFDALQINLPCTIRETAMIPERIALVSDTTSYIFSRVLISYIPTIPTNISELHLITCNTRCNCRRYTLHGPLLSTREARTFVTCRCINNWRNLSRG